MSLLLNGITCMLLVYLSSCSRSKPEDVVREYREVKKWEDRLKFVRNPEVVKPLMETYYRRANVKFPQPYVEIINSSNSSVSVGEWTQVEVVVSKGKNAFNMDVIDKITYDIQLTPSGYKIDWESSIPYNPMTAMEFNSLKPSKPVRFRAVAKLSDIYPIENKKFREEHWSVNLILQQRRTFGSIENLGTAFIPKRTEDGVALFELIRDGRDHPVTIEVSYLPGSHYVDWLLIEKFNHVGWREPDKQ